jgi:hypothetical protein
MSFVRIDERGWEHAPSRVPMFPGDLPRQDHPLRKALDDATAAKLLRAAHADKRLLVGVTVEMLLRTVLRVGEYTGLQKDAVVHIGADVSELVAMTTALAFHLFAHPTGSIRGRARIRSGAWTSVPTL